jgi:hypothetical protein
VIAVGCIYLACKIKDEYDGKGEGEERQDLSTFHDPVAPCGDALNPTGIEHL